MSTFQRMTLIGLYNYDAHLFDNLSLPEGYDQTTFIESLLLEHGEKCVLYTDPDFMKYSIGVVSRKWYSELERIYAALSAEYNPIWNYDRNEEYTDEYSKENASTTEADYNNDRTADLEHKRTADLEDKRTPDLNEQTTNNTTDTTTQSVAGTTERQVAAFNSSNYENSEKTIANNGTNELAKTGTIDVDMTGSDTVTHTGTDTTTETGTDKTNIKGTLADVSGSESGSTTHEAHLWGNIGVTTSMQMVQEEVNLRFKNNLYGIAGRIFANELLIQIY